MSERKPWEPSISAKQRQILTLKQKYALITGPRFSTKTRGILHAIVNHAWKTPNALVAMVGRTQTVNSDGGPWSVLHKYTIPEWIEGNFGLEYVVEPKMDGATHKLICDIRNKFGGISRIQLDSLAVEKDAETRFKGKEYSMIYMTEASTFESRNTFDILQECLRGNPQMKSSDYKFILDTNPPENGEDNWMYKLFWEERLREDFDDIEDKRLVEIMKRRQEQFAVMEFTVDDNIFVTQEERDAQYAKYCHSQDLLDRFYYGKWVKAVTDSLFSEQFRPNIHIIGDPPDKRDAEILIPEESCGRLGTGQDIGGTNTAVVVIEPLVRIELHPGRDGKLVEREVPWFKVLDEVVVIGKNTPLSTIVDLTIDSMDYWEAQIPGKVQWRHISDRSAFEKYDNIADSYEYLEVVAQSGGRIVLERGPVKKSGSVQIRVNILQKLLFQDRIFVSSKCVRLIEMFNNLKKGKKAAVDPGSQYKHVFDALTYFICMICQKEMMEMALLATSRREEQPRRIIRLSL